MASCGAIYPFRGALDINRLKKKRSTYIKHYVANFHSHVEYQRQFVVLAKTSNHTCDGTTPAHFRTDMPPSGECCAARNGEFSIITMHCKMKQILWKKRSEPASAASNQIFMLNAFKTPTAQPRASNASAPIALTPQSLTNNCIHWRASRWRKTKSCWPRRDSDASSTSVKRPIAGAKDDKVPAPHPGHAGAPTPRLT